MTDVLDLAKRLMAAPSVTPATGAVFDVLAAELAAQGFEVDRFVEGEPPEGPVENLIATRGSGAPHFAFAGHLDVVPPGEGWSSGAFEPEVRGDLLYGRGAVDMKGSIAAFAAATARVAAHKGTVSFLITGDEEGPAKYGTRKIIERMAARGIAPDMIVVGEPTSSQRFGDMIKIGRRGSMYITISVDGTQGHVAYPHLADNPLRPLIRILAKIEAMKLDEGTDWFQASNCEVTSIDVGNPTGNVIPSRGQARMSIRFNDLHTGMGLVERIRAIAESESDRAALTYRISGEAFLTQPGPLSDLVSAAIVEATGVTPELSTTGGTSDARFLSKLAPTCEFGLVNATMHKLDEAVAVADLEALVDVYAGVLRRALA